MTGRKEDDTAEIGPRMERPIRFWTSSILTLLLCLARADRRLLDQALLFHQALIDPLNQPLLNRLRLLLQTLTDPHNQPLLNQRLHRAPIDLLSQPLLNQPLQPQYQNRTPVDQPRLLLRAAVLVLKDSQLLPHQQSSLPAAKVLLPWDLKHLRKPGLSAQHKLVLPGSLPTV